MVVTPHEAPTTPGRSPGEGSGPPAPRRGRRRGLRRALVALAVVVGALGGAFVWAWNHSGPHQVSEAAAVAHFRAQPGDRSADPGSYHPPDGVYRYRGSGTEHVSLPSKTVSEGPGLPGTVTSAPDGCWTFRLDYSDAHWQSSTYCPRGGRLVEVGRAGWYRWDFVAFAISDRATFTCPTPEVVAAPVRPGTAFAFRCTGRNQPVHMAPVLMRGTDRYLGTVRLRVGGRSVAAAHWREQATFSGGQQGSYRADTWLSTADGLPLRSSWSETVRSPTIVGTSTLTAHASFALASFAVTG